MEDISITEKLFEEKYKGKSIIGFGFSRRHKCGWADPMEDYIKQTGTAIRYTKNYDAFDVLFDDGKVWLYPADLCIAQIERNSKTNTDLFLDISSLIKSIK